MNRIEFTHHIDETAEATIVSLKGPIDFRHRSTIAETLQKVRENSSKKIFVIDLEGVDYIDSVGIGTLVAERASCLQSGFHLRFCNLQDFVKKVLTMTHLDRVFDVYATRDEALQIQVS